jgi:integrase
MEMAMADEMKVTKFQRAPGVWRIRIETKDEAGRRKFSTETLKGTEIDAEARRIELLKSAHAGDLVEITADTVRQHWAKWQRRRVGLQQISDLTHASQENLIKTFLALYGDRPLKSIDRDDIEAFYMARIRQVGPGTMTITHHHLKAMFNQAVAAGVLAKNPMKKVAAPKGESEARKPLEKRHIKALLTYAADKPFLGRMIRLALATGMRRGEMCALRWSDVDLETGIVHVARTVVRVGQAEYEKKPKTAKSVRSIRMTKSLWDELKACAGKPDKHVLQTVWGDRPTLSYMTSATKDALRAIGLDEGYCLHSTRHSHATHLLREKMPLKAVSERLGHANVEVTMIVYAGVLTGDDQELAATMDRVVNG